MGRRPDRAVAVADAHPDVVAAAHEVTASNDEEGVAAWLAAALGRRVPRPSDRPAASRRLPGLDGR